MIFFQLYKPQILKLSPPLSTFHIQFVSPFFQYLLTSDAFTLAKDFIISYLTLSIAFSIDWIYVPAMHETVEQQEDRGALGGVREKVFPHIIRALAPL